MSKKIETRLIGQTIKQLRLSRNWTQAYLADVIGYSERNLRRIENDGTGSIDVVNTFAELFGVSAIDILNGDVFSLLLNRPRVTYFLSAMRLRLISLIRSKTISGASSFLIIITLVPLYSASFQC